MHWAFLKITLALAIPLSTVAYATQLRHQHDCQRIQSIVQKPGDLTWSLAHPREFLQRNRAEMRSLRPLLKDLDS
jgi:hypothetical protein